MTEISYKPNLGGTGRLMRSPEMVAMVESAARKGQAFAVSISPERTGDYARSFHVESKSDGGPHHDRAEARLVNTSDHAVLVETWDDYHVLARTADYIRATGP